MTNFDDIYAIDDRTQAFENHQKGLLISLAGPGTGKTYSFLLRIRALVSRDNTHPTEICYLTFIKVIAKAFLSDYQQEFPANLDELSRPRVSTLHSFACRLIRNRGFSLGYDGPLYFASIADSESSTSQVFLTDLHPIVQTSGPRSIPQLRDLLQKVKQAWRDNADPQTLPEPIPAVLDVGIRLARAYRLVDWDHAIRLAHELFHDPRNRHEWLTQLKHYLVDEYQDFNRAEHAFIESLASTVSSMVIVGDENQSIFGSRGGSPKGMRNLFQSSGHDRVSLLRCHRCKTNILSVANRFLRWMSPTSQPMLEQKTGGTARCYNFKSTKAEIAFLVNYLTAKVAELPDNPSPKDGIVCLFPLRKALSFYYERIKPNVSSYTKIAEIHPIRQQLALLLELVCNPNQRFIERLILDTFAAIKPRHKLEMVRLVLQHDVSPSEAIEQLISASVLSGTAVTAGQRFIELCHSLSSQDPHRISNILADHLRREPEELRPFVEDLLNRCGEIDQEDLINTICDRALPEYALPTENRHSVLFLTIHGSKGLTKKTVVLPGFEHAWLPGGSSGADLEEKKRLFYIAITRASDNLLITYPRTRARGDPLNYRTPGRGRVSRFVKQSGIHDVHHA